VYQTFVLWDINMLSYLLDKFFNRSNKSYPEKKKYLEWKEDNGKHIGFYNGKFEYIIEEKVNPDFHIKMASLCNSKYTLGWYKDVDAAKNDAEEQAIDRFGPQDHSDYMNVAY